jgi:hypothetical protein
MLNTNAFAEVKSDKILLFCYAEGSAGVIITLTH